MNHRIVLVSLLAVAACSCAQEPVPRSSSLAPLTIRTTAACSERREEESMRVAGEANARNMVVYSALLGVVGLEPESVISASALLCDVAYFGPDAGGIRPCLGSEVCPPSAQDGALRCVSAPVVELEGSRDGGTPGRVRVACGRSFMNDATGYETGYRYETVILTLTRDASDPVVPE